MWSALELWRRIRMLVASSGFDRDIDEEMRLHVDLRAARLREEGSPPHVAEDAARRRFGNAVQLKQESRDAWGWTWLFELWSDIDFGWRSLRRAPVLTAATILVLGVAAGVNTAIFATVHTVLLTPLPFPDSDRLVRIHEQHPRRGVEHVSPRNYLDWRAQTDAFDDLAFVVTWRNADRFTLIDRNAVEALQGAWVSGRFFPMLAPRPLLGRYFSAAGDGPGAAPVVVLSERLWRRRFDGDPAVLGRVVTLEAGRRASLTVIGVAPEAFDYPTDADVWVPAGLIGEGTFARRSAPWFDVVGRLKHGVTVDAARVELERLQARISASADTLDVSPGVAVTPLIEDTVKSVRPVLVLLQASAFVVLLLACANVANLLIVAGTTRYREMAVRAALGASPKRLFRLISIESLMRAVLAAVVGILIAMGALHLVRASDWLDIPRLSAITLSPPVLLVALLGAFGAAFVFGLAPALHLLRSGRMDRLREADRSMGTTPHTTRAQRLLTVIQVAFTLTLLVTGGLLLQSLYRLQNVELGFVAGGLAAARLDFSGAAYSTSARPGPNRPQDITRRILNRLELLPGVRAAAADLLPTRGSIIGEIVIEPSSSASTLEADVLVRAVTPNYFDVVGIPLLAGRPLADSDTEATKSVVLINETMAKRYFGGRNPIGHRLNLHTGSVQPEVFWDEVVGVVGDARNGGARQDPQPEVFSPYYQWAWNEAYIFVRSDASLSEQSAALSNVVTSINPEQPTPVLVPVNDILAADHADARLRTALVVAFGLVALSLAAVATFAMVAAGVTQRTKEIGLRRALGASPFPLCYLVAAESLRLVLRGTAIGLAGAVVSGQLIRPLLFQVSGHDASTFAAAILTVGAVCGVAIGLSLWRALRIAPQQALRETDG